MEKTQETMFGPSTGSMLSAGRGLLVLEGVIQLLLAFLFLTSPVLTTISLVRFLGFYWLIRGIIHIVQIFTQKSTVHWGWLLLAGSLGIISGLLVLQHPIVSTVIASKLTFYFILFTGFFQGITSVAQGIKGEGSWSVLLGIIVLLICFYLLFNPFGAGLAIPLILGFILLFGGVSSLIYASFFKKD